MFGGFFDMLANARAARLPTADEALPGRAARPFPVGEHLIFKRPMLPPYPPNSRWVQLGLGCFWGAERRFWQQPGVVLTAAGYSGGHSPHPLYKEVCSGRTGHAETVLVHYDPTLTDLVTLLRVFFEAHDPTQGMRQGNDVGTQYRSAIYAPAEDLPRCKAILDAYAAALAARGHGAPTTELRESGPLESFFFYAEPEHQQYLARNPDGYCGLRGTGVSCPIPAPAG
jgi:peptide-methionine (S)-S-oxide reductase